MFRLEVSHLQALTILLPATQGAGQRSLHGEQKQWQKTSTPKRR